jgi:tetratricopeptide (TPR) repeat protein
MPQVDGEDVSKYGDALRQAHVTLLNNLCQTLISVCRSWLAQTNGLSFVMQSRLFKCVTDFRLLLCSEFLLTWFFTSVRRFQYGAYEKAKKTCEEALALDPKNIKALYRMGAIHNVCGSAKHQKDRHGAAVLC